VLAVATRLGLTSFGGPVAHLGYFRDEYVVRRRWLDEAQYADLVALTQFLPGPSSSQLGIAIGALRAGRLGAVAAWLGFTLPSAAALVLFAYGVGGLDDPDAGWLQGLKVAAVAVVALAVVGMARLLAPDLPRNAIALAAAATMLLWDSVLGQLVPLAAAALVGAAFLSAPEAREARPFGFARSRRVGAAALATFALLLAGLPLAGHVTDSHAVDLADSMYWSGSLVFGGGHVVLPLLDAAVVEPGWVSREDFVAGYGAAQAVPGPLFTFSAYLGAVQRPEPNGVAGASIALVAIFLPSFLLLAGVLPLWDAVRRRPGLRSALAGVGAAVVGLVLAALWDPVIKTGIDEPADAVLAAVLLLLLAGLKLPAWAVVGIAAAAGAALAAVGLT
jgi:chromate transporter